jgi:hypothetical protein
MYSFAIEDQQQRQTVMIELVIQYRCITCLLELYCGVWLHFWPMEGRLWSETFESTLAEHSLPPQ